MNGAARRPWPWIVLLVALAVAAAAAIYHLLWVRFASGNIFPEGSSLRHDGKGTSVLFTALSRLPESAVSQNFHPLEVLPVAPATWIFTGVPAGGNERYYGYNVRDWAKIEAIAAEGGRVIIAFCPAAPELRLNPWEKRKVETDPDKTEAGKPDGKIRKKEQEKDSPPLSEDSEEREISWREKCEEWGVKIEYVRSSSGLDVIRRNVPRVQNQNGIPPTLGTSTALYFQTDGRHGWTPLYEAGDRISAAEKKWGKGEIIIVADGGALSNEAMAWRRQLGWVNWLVQGPGPIIFDETHLRIMDQPGAAVLARRYGLSATAMLLLLTGLLFVWKNTSSLVPRLADEWDESAGGIVTGVDSTRGFANMLHRGIRSADLITTCIDAWRGSTSWIRLSAEQRRRIDEIAVAQKQSPSREAPRQLYRRIQSICEKR